MSTEAMRTSLVSTEIFLHYTRRDRIFFVLRNHIVCLETEILQLPQEKGQITYSIGRRLAKGSKQIEVTVDNKHNLPHCTAFIIPHLVDTLLYYPLIQCMMVVS
jgi:hypothetical protein